MTAKTMTTLAIPTVALAFALMPQAAAAYVGPGAGLTAIGTILALLAAVFFAIVGFVWYPVKRMMRKSTATKDKQG